jgi:hypothetical protein
MFNFMYKAPLPTRLSIDEKENLLSYIPVNKAHV